MKTDEIQAAAGSSAAGSGSEQGQPWFRRFWHRLNWRRRLRWDFGTVRVALAALLLLAAVLKSEQLWASSPQPFASPTFALIVFEFTFAAWLLTGWLPRFTWWLALACFTTFGLVAGARMLSGQSDCGCFGTVRLPPVAAWWIDLVLLVLLLNATWTLQRVQKRGVLRWSAWGVLLCGVCVASFVYTQRPNDRDPVGALEVGFGIDRQWPTPAALHCDEPHWTFGAVNPESHPTVQHTFRLENRSATPVQIHDVKADCGCILIEQTWGKAIPPGGAWHLPIRVAIPTMPGSLAKTIRVTFEPSAAPLELRLTGYVDSADNLIAFPQAINFGEVPPDPAKCPSRVFLVSRHNERLLGALTVRASDERLRVSEISGSAVARRYRVDLRPTHAFDSSRRPTIEVQTTSPASSVILPVYFTIRPSLVRHIFIPLLGRGETVTLPLFEESIALSEDLTIDRLHFEGDPSLSVTWPTRQGAGYMMVSRSSDDLAVPVLVTGRVLLENRGAKWSIPVTAYYQR